MNVVQRKFHVGTCGYSYPGAAPKGWHGVFYPEATLRHPSELEFYASYLDLVEINSTFYRPPTPAMARGWAASTAEGFKFAIKAWQKFTHPRPLGLEKASRAGPWEPFDAGDVRLFSDAIIPLMEAGKLAALLFQYPAGFHRVAENLERLERTLEAFDNFPKTVELRHRSWSDHAAQTLELLNNHGGSWVFIDEPKFPSSVRQKLDVYGDLTYLRLHGRNRAHWWRHDEAWERYDYLYSYAEIQRLAAKLKTLAGKFPDARFLVLFNNHARGQAVANALMLKAELDPRAPRRAPRSMIESFAELRNFTVDDDVELFS